MATYRSVCLTACEDCSFAMSILFSFGALLYCRRALALLAQCASITLASPHSPRWHSCLSATQLPIQCIGVCVSAHMCMCVHACICMCMCMCICITPGSFLTGYGLMGRDLLPTAVIGCLKFLIYFTKLQKLCGNEFTTLSWNKHRFSWDLESLIRVCSCLSKVVFC